MDFKTILIVLLIITVVFLMINISSLKSVMDISEATYELELSVRNLKISNLDKELEIYKYLYDMALNRKTIPITDEERDLAERVVYAEIGNGDLSEQMSVAQVIWDRMYYWGKDLHTIVYANGQFAKPTNKEVPQLTKDAVWMVFNANVRIFEEPTTHFYAYNKCEPEWASTKVERGKDRYHRFMY